MSEHESTENERWGVSCDEFEDGEHTWYVAADPGTEDEVIIAEILEFSLDNELAKRRAYLLAGAPRLKALVAELVAALEDAIFKCWGCQGRGGIGGINQFTECEVCRPWRAAITAATPPEEPKNE